MRAGVSRAPVVQEGVDRPLPRPSWTSAGRADEPAGRLRVADGVLGGLEIGSLHPGPASAALRPTTVKPKTHGPPEAPRSGSVAPLVRSPGRTAAAVPVYHGKFTVVAQCQTSPVKLTPTVQWILILVALYGASYNNSHRLKTMSASPAAPAPHE